MIAVQREFKLAPSVDLLPGERIIDLFAGGGGASLGIERATGRSPDFAVNHDQVALETHQLNHPSTLHMREDIWRVLPLEVTMGDPVGLLWASPDCRHFSRAKGGKPVSRRVRSLANVVIKWARDVNPRIICMENVREFQTWGPLLPDGMPDKNRSGIYYRRWVRSLERLGYQVESRLLCAADYGAPTSRKRLFIIARRDGKPICWPEPTHGPGREFPWRTAAECIDWSIPCPSIFERKKPLAEATLRRIARGVVKYVLEDPEPFIVNLTHGGRVESIDEPLRTVTGAHRGEKALVAASLLTNTSGHPGRRANQPLSTVTTGGHHGLVGCSLAHLGNGERPGQKPRAQDPKKPLGTVVAGGKKHAFVAAHLTKFQQNSVGQKPVEPFDTVMAGAPRFGLVSTFLSRHYGNSIGQGIKEPAPTIMPGGGGKTGLQAVHLTKFRANSTGLHPSEPLHAITGGGGGAGGNFGLVAAFLAKYYGTAVGQKPTDPLHSITSKDRFGVVTVKIQGQEYALVDIGMRMLQPHELAAAQGFDSDYFLLGNKTQQVRLIGNSVCPDVAEAVVRENLTG